MSLFVVVFCANLFNRWLFKFQDTRVCARDWEETKCHRYSYIYSYILYTLLFKFLGILCQDTRVCARDWEETGLEARQRVGWVEHRHPESQFVSTFKKVFLSHKVFDYIFFLELVWIKSSLCRFVCPTCYVYQPIQLHSSRSTVTHIWAQPREPFAFLNSNFWKVKVFLLKIDFHKGLYGRLRRRARDKARRARYSSQPSVTTHGLGIAGPDITITITIIMTITTTIITITTKITITTHSLRITRPDINFLSSSMKFWPLKTSPKITKYFSRNNQICSQFNKIIIISELNVPLKFYLHFFVLSKKKSINSTWFRWSSPLFWQSPSVQTRAFCVEAKITEIQTNGIVPIPAGKHRWIDSICLKCVFSFLQEDKIWRF